MYKLITLALLLTAAQVSALKFTNNVVINQRPGSNSTSALQLSDTQDIGMDDDEEEDKDAYVMVGDKKRWNP